MKLCHLYYQNKQALFIDNLGSLFPSSNSLDIANIESLDEYDVYILEFEKIDKTLMQNIRALFENKPHALLYFLVSKEYNLLLFQLAFLLGSKAFFTPTQDADKIFAKIKNDMKLHEEEFLHTLLGKITLQSQLFLLFKKEKLFFASKSFLQDFNCTNLEEIQKNILSTLDIKEILSKDALHAMPIENRHKQDYFYHLRTISINQKNEKVLFFEPFIQKKNLGEEFSFIIPRLSFIELLKDKIIETGVEHKPLSLVTIQIENMSSLRKSMNELEIENMMRDFLLQVKILLQNKIFFGQYDKDLYVALFEKNSFEEVEKIANEFHLKLSNYLQKQKNIPLVGLFATDITKENLNDVLVTLENILHKRVSEESGGQLIYISNVQENMDEAATIRNLLETVYVNATEIKLLNIYKGLCINTSAKVIKVTDDDVYVAFQNLQGPIMKVEGETVLQSSRFLKDIRANVRHVSLEKNVAIIKDFSFLNASANARKYSRVTCSAKTLVVLSHKGATLNGEISDISVTSLAIEAKYAKIFDTLLDQVVMLTFVLPSRTTVEGVIKMQLQAKVAFTSCSEKSCKVVCEFLKDPAAEAVLMEYVYNRQKEIILELKQITKSNRM